MKSDLYRAGVHKFSCKPPGHDAARQRENQRRHRARVKGRIAELEALLASTQASLADAMRQIEALTAEVDRLRRALDSRPVSSDEGKCSPDSPDSNAGDRDLPPLVLESSPDDRGDSDEPDTSESSDALRDTTSPVDVSFPGALGSPFCSSSCTGSQPGRESRCSREALPPPSSPPPPAIPTTPTPSSDINIDPDTSVDVEVPDDDCPFLPPPKPGESTIPCREAFSMLRDRFRGISGASAPDFDLDAAAEWLRPGFRRAVVPGAGCRVQTHVLFAFVDLITSL